MSGCKVLECLILERFLHQFEKKSSMIPLGVTILTILVSEATKPFVTVFLNLMKSFLPWPPSSSSTMPNLASTSSQFFSEEFRL